MSSTPTSHPYSFPKTARLRKHGQYQRVGHKHKRLVGKLIIVDSQQRNQDFIRLGITVTKKYGSAVERNRFKRITRDAFRLCRSILPQGIDMIIKPRSDAHRATSKEIQQELIHLLTA